MDEKALRSLLRDLIELPDETEWVEFKHNNANPEEIGEYLSAMSNAAALHKKQSGYIVWGIEDETHKVLGTKFVPSKAKFKKQELENWLCVSLRPKIDFRHYAFDFDGKPVVLYEVPAATGQPVSFGDEEFIRVGSYKKRLKDHPEKERALWQILSNNEFERGIAKSGLTARDVLTHLAIGDYYRLIKQPIDTDAATTLDRLCHENFCMRTGQDRFDITNLGAVLFATNLNDFDRISRKAVRMMFYKGADRTLTLREQPGIKGYAAGFVGAINYLNSQLPQNEEIQQALRVAVPLYPELALRELVANALVHQDFSITGTGPMVEVFNDRIEITNPGRPLIDVDRFLDLPPRSRNERLNACMRRLGYCEERGSGIDKVIFSIEFHQLPPPEFIVTDHHTKAILFAPRRFSEMDQRERMRACYQHACLMQVSNKKLTNESLRKRLGIEDDNYPMASRVIRDAIDAKLIKPFGETARRSAKYVPYWA